MRMVYTECVLSINVGCVCASVCGGRLFFFDALVKEQVRNYRPQDDNQTCLLYYQGWILLPQSTDKDKTKESVARNKFSYTILWIRQLGHNWGDAREDNSILAFTTTITSQAILLHLRAGPSTPHSMSAAVPSTVPLTRWGWEVNK